MSAETSAYGLWGLVLVNSVVFILFAYSFFKPRTPRDWRSFSAFSAFLVALFAEMYGFPLRIYFLSGWLQRRYPGIDWFSHDAGHLLEMLFGWKTNPHAGPFHILSFIFIGSGFVLIARAWSILYEAQHRHELATTGPYGTASTVRRLHPGDARISRAVADPAHSRDVSDLSDHVRAASPPGRTRGPNRIRSGLRSICRQDAGLVPAAWRHRKDGAVASIGVRQREDPVSGAPYKRWLFSSSNTTTAIE